VADATARQADERRVAALVGRSVVAVRYVELDYSDGGGTAEPLWGGEGFDALDFGLEFDLDDGTTWSFIWRQAGHNEGLLAYEGTLRPAQLMEDAGRFWDVGSDSGWSAMLDRPVQAVEGAWLRHQWDVRGESDLCVITWVLRFEGDRDVVITLGDRREDGCFHYIADNVAVFFSLDEAKRRDVLLPGDDQAA